MANSILDLVVKLTLDDSEIDSGLKGAKDRLVGGVGKAATIASGAVVAGFGAAIKTTADFDASMSQVQATMLKTNEEMEKEVGKVSTAYGDFEGNLRDFARFLGSQTAFSAKEAADALNYMALAGYNTQESMEMLPNVLSLAAAGGFDLARASDMVTDSQTAFGIDAKRTTQMVDEMAKAASTGNTSVEQLGDAFLVVGGLAQELNGGMVTLKNGTTQSVDGLQELEIALTAMANAGVKGSEAGTHMRNMLLKLSSPTDKGTIALKEMGVTVFDTEGHMRSLSDIFGDLSQQLGKMTQEQKIQTISELFNTRDLASAEALLNAVSQDWDEIGESILDAEGSAAKMAEIQLDNLGGQLTILKSALQELAISFGTLLMPEIRKLAEHLQNLADKLNSMSDDEKQAIITGGKVIIVLAGITKGLIGIGKVARSIKDISTLMGGLKTTASEASTAVSAVSKAGSAAASGASSVSGAISAAGSFMTADVGATVAAGGAAAGATIGTAIVGGAVAAVGGAEAGKKIGAALFPDDKELYESYSGIKGTFEMLGDFFSTLGSRIAEHAQNAWSAIKTGFSNLGEAIVNSEATQKIFDFGTKISEWWEQFKEGFSMGLEFIKTNWEENWQAISDFFAPIIDAIKYTAGAAWDWIEWKITEKLTSIYNNVMSIWNAIVAFITPILETIKNAINTAWQAIMDFVTLIMDSLKEKFANDWEMIKSGIEAVHETIKSIIETAYNFIEEHIFSKLYSIQEKVAEVWENIKTNITEKVQSAVDTVKELFNGLGEFFGGLAEKAAKWGSDMMDGFKQGIKDGRDKVASGIRGVGDKIKANIGHSHPTEGPLADDYKWMGDMMDLFAGGIKSNAGKVTGALDDLTGDMYDTMDMSTPAFEYAGGYGMMDMGAGSSEDGGGYGDVVTAITDALMNMQLMVNIGNRPIEAMVTGAQQRTTYRSGGR